MTKMVFYRDASGHFRRCTSVVINGTTSTLDLAVETVRLDSVWTGSHWQAEIELEYLGTFGPIIVPLDENQQAEIETYIFQNGLI